MLNINIFKLIDCRVASKIMRIPDFHSGNRGSIPLSPTSKTL